MKIEEVVRRAIEDPDFAAELKKAGEAATHAGRGTSAHKDLMTMFGLDEATARGFEAEPNGPTGCHTCGLGTSAFIAAVGAALKGLTTGNCN